MDRTHVLPITRQAQLLGISRSNLYYRPVAASAEDLRGMRRIDELHLELPFAGSRMLRDMLNPLSLRSHAPSETRNLLSFPPYQRHDTNTPS